MFLSALVFIELVGAQSEKEFSQINQRYKSSKFLNFDEALGYAKKGISIANNLPDTTLKLEALNNLSEIYLFRSNNKEASVVAREGLELSKELENMKMKSIFLHRIGILEKRLENYKEAYLNCQEALNLALKFDFEDMQSKILISLALLDRDRRNYENAFIQIRKAINIAEENKNETILSDAYNVYGALHFNKKKDSAIYYYNESLKLTRSTKNEYLQSIVLSNLGDLYLNLRNYQEAFKSLNRSILLAEKVGNNYILFFINVSLGIYNARVGNYALAETHYKTAIDSYGSYVGAIKKLNAYWLLGGTYDHLGKYKEGFYLQEKYIILNDSLFNLNKAKEIEELKTQYKVEKKDSQITLLKTKNELEATRKKWILATASFLVIGISFLAFFYKQRVRTLGIISKQEKALHAQEQRNLKNEQELKTSKALIKGQDEERHRIAKELHDGVGGQLANVTLGLTNLNAHLENSEIKTINNQLLNVFKDLRGVSHRLNSNYLTDKTFEQLLAEMQSMYENAGFLLDISVFPDDCLNTIQAKTKHHLYRVLQELLANITKHAKANEVVLTITAHQDMLSIIVEDNGSGFDVENNSEGVGLRNIRERITSIDGNLILDSKIGQGTTVIIEIPNTIIA